MKISAQWLNEYVGFSESPDRLKADLSMQGLLVEGIETVGDSTVLDVEITSNRPDCLSHIGMAREVAAIYDRPLRMPPVADTLTLPAGEADRIPFAIEIADPDLCPRYVGLVMDNVTVGPSPAWMQRRLEAAGMRPLNNVVDITNYVLLEMGHPLHAFDFDSLRGGKIVVRRAAPGTEFTTLDGVTRQLDGEMLLINDAEGPVAIAGVMGGLDSEIATSTTRILLEAAYFTPASVRRTSRRLGLSTEASYRFERGADWDGVTRAIARACYLVEQLAGGRVAGSVRDVYPAPKEPVRIELSRERAGRLLGVNIAADFIVTTLERLGFTLEPQGARESQSRESQSDDVWLVTCPTFRADMELEADLIEEVARFYGYDNIPATLPPSQTAGTPSPVYALENAIRDTLCGFGHYEAVNLSFATGADHFDFPPLVEFCGSAERVAVSNPLTEDTRYMRTTLAAGLVHATKRNFNVGQRAVRLFEIGKAYFPDATGRPTERNVLGIAGTGSFYNESWLNGEAAYTFYQMKGLVTALGQRLRLREFTIAPWTGVAWLDPADTAALLIGGELVGVMGTLHPALEEKFKLRQPLLLAEIDLGRMAPAAFAPVVYKPLPRLPAAERDISVIVGRELTFKDIDAGLRGLGMAELTDVRLIDVYEGEKIPEEKVSITLRLTFLDREKTLTMERVQSFMDKVLLFLQNSYGAGLR